MAAGRDLNETLQDFLSACARFLLYAGAVAAVGAAGLLIFTIIRMADPGAASQTADALRNVGIFQNVLLVSVLAAGVGASYMFWGEDLLSGGLLILAAVLYFAPLYIPMMVANSDQNDAGRKSYEALQSAGTWLGVIAIIVVVADLFNRVRNRSKEGVKADLLKYGKGVKQEQDRENVFLGKCWQLPFCRKFVRERCPIYHSKRTCWKEQVGCMCEEQVIKGAMENRPIPKDALLAAQMIPRNHKLTPAQKKERCNVCVIYNEHQRHKYRALLPGVLAGFIAFYALFRGPLMSGMTALVGQINKVMYGFTYGASGQQKIPVLFTEMLLVVFFLVALSYALKMIEYAVFKLKI